MNKLVSRNPVQRFKEEKIVKAYRGAKTIYGRDAHELMGYKVNGENVAYVNIPGKGYIAVDDSGNAYTYDETPGNGLKRDSFRPIKLTNYDLDHVVRASQRDSGMTSISPNISTRIAKYWATQQPRKSLNVSKNNNSNENVVAVGTNKGQGIQKTNIKTGKSGGQSFRQAFNAARNAGLKEFTWNGDRFNTMTAAEKEAGATTFQNGKWVAPVSMESLPTTEEAYNFKPADNTTIANPKVTPQSTVVQNDFAASKQANYPTISRGQQLLNAITLRPEYKNIGQFNWRDALKYTFSAKQGGQLVSRNPIQRFKQRNFS